MPEDWRFERPLARARGLRAVTQLEHARLGIVTPEMRRVAEREPHLTPEQVRDEVAAGRMIIPANRVHLGTSSTRCASAARPHQDQRQHGRVAGLVAAPTRRSRSFAGPSAGAPTP